MGPWDLQTVCAAVRKLNKAQQTPQQLGKHVAKQGELSNSPYAAKSDMHSGQGLVSLNGRIPTQFALIRRRIEYSLSLLLQRHLTWIGHQLSKP